MKVRLAFQFEPVLTPDLPSPPPDRVHAFSSLFYTRLASGGWHEAASRMHEGCSEQRLYSLAPGSR